MKIATDYELQCKSLSINPNQAIIRTFKTKEESDEVNLVFRGNFKLNFNQRMTDKDLIVLLAAADHFKDSVRHIDFSFNEISDTGIQALTKFIVGCSQLESLNLQSNQITSVGGEMVVSAIKDLQTLKYLNLDRNNI